MLKIRPTKILLLLCITTTIIVATFSMAKFKTTVNSSNNAKVAVPLIELGTNTLELKISPADKEKTYNFKVANNKGEETTQVSMQYTLQIKTLNNLPLDFELYTFENETIGTTNLLNGNITDQIPISLESKEQCYQLKIKWRQEEKSYKYANAIDYIQIVMNSEQLD